MKTFFAALASVALAQYPITNDFGFNTAASADETWSQEQLFQVAVLSADVTPVLFFQHSVDMGTDTLTNNQCILQWSKWNNWSNDASTHQWMFNYMRSDANGGSLTSNVSCGDTATTDATGVTNNRSLKTTDCTDAWFASTDGSVVSTVGTSVSVIGGYRAFVSGTTAIDLALGDSVTVQHGFSSYATPATSVAPTHVVAGADVTFVLSDNAVALTLSAAAAAVAALAF